ncbi:MAG TPA: hypothetical protein VFM18_10030, partial [Methanosarcina sp.]|nr:hypothetical protein [Methanosarcina sp.]
MSLIKFHLWQIADAASKQDALVSGTNIKTINGLSILGTGNITAGLNNFAEARNVAVPNDVTPAHQLTPSGAETDIDFVLTPKGHGAILAQIPDNAITGGNKRGVNSIDFQTSRASADQVASGTYGGILSGANSKITSNYIGAVIAGGSTNSINDTSTTYYYPFIGGGAGNFCQANYGVIAGGHSNTVSAGADGGAVLGGQSNYVAS